MKNMCHDIQCIDHIGLFLYAQLQSIFWEATNKIIVMNKTNFSNKKNLKFVDIFKTKLCHQLVINYDI